MNYVNSVNQDTAEVSSPVYNMLNHRNWVLWKKAYRNGESKATKIPLNGNNPHVTASSTDETTWADWSLVRNYYECRQLLCPEVDGIGFVFTDSPFWGIDLDGVIDPVSGEWTDTAKSIVSMFPTGVYIEYSQSGAGLHIFGAGKKPQNVGCKSADRVIEVYDNDRYFAMTFKTIQGSVDYITDTSSQLAAVCTTFLTSDKPGSGSRRHDMKIEDWGVAPNRNWSGPEDDDALIELMLSDFSFKAAHPKIDLGALWTGDIAKLVELGYTVKTGDRAGEYDASSADQSLMNCLAYWTGEQPDRMRRLFMRSGIVRAKHTRREKYMEWTVWKAINDRGQYVSGVYSPRKEVSFVSQDETFDVYAHTRKFTTELVDTNDQMELFKGCVYVNDRAAIFTPDGTFHKRDQFNNGPYAGHEFIIGNSSKNKTTTSAWDAFTQNRLTSFPKVATTRFRPDLPKGIIEIEGEISLNTYVPVKVKKIFGADVSRFTDHIRKMFSDERDYSIIMAYLAAVVQYPGVKFQWCPVIQGTEGNGKTLIIRCMKRAIGERYVYSVDPKKLTSEGGGRFNTWIEGHIFIDIDEIYVGDRIDMMETLKPIITGERLSLEGKGVNQTMGDNRANFLMSSNHKGAVVKTKDDRRYAVFYTTQQCADDCKRDGVDERYFKSLYEWLNNEDGYAKVAGFLSTYSIPDEFNPATVCQRAPFTSCTTEAIVDSLGPVEQIIIEATQDGSPGFRDGWISSVMLTKLMADHGRRMIGNRRIGTIMTTLGYVRHPGLKDGRLSLPIMQECAKRPTLYIKKDSPLIFENSDDKIMEAYFRSQNYSN